MGPDAWDATGPDAIVDWVLVELRDATDAARILSTRCGLVQRDGDVVAADGGSPLELSAVPGPYHIALHHRNHLPVITATPIELGMGADVDMASGAVPLAGTEPRQQQGAVRALWSGDVNGDHEIRYTGANNDHDLVLQEVGGVVPTNVAVGYLASDVNMDGQVKYTGAGNDRDPILITIGGTVPTTVRIVQLP